LDGFADYHDEINSQIRHYLIGLLNIYLGEFESAGNYIDELKAMESPPYARPGILSLANLLLTLIRKNEGQLEEALHLLDQETPRIFWPHMWLSPFFSLAAQRYLRAEILYEMGRYEEALRWYKTFHFSYFYDILYRAGSYFRCGEIYEKLGRTNEAINSYSRFVKLWSECDPELLSIVEQARSRIERLD
jgi:tetratricopeptide (TPR) repeat protein